MGERVGAVDRPRESRGIGQLALAGREAVFSALARFPRKLESAIVQHALKVRTSEKETAVMAPGIGSCLGDLSFLPDGRYLLIGANGPLLK